MSLSSKSLYQILSLKHSSTLVLKRSIFRAFSTQTPRLLPTTVVTTGDTGKAESPLERYNRLVKLGKLRDDEFQRNMIASLGDLYKDLCDYKPPFVERPDPMNKSNSFFSKMLHPFQSSSSSSNEISQYSEKVPMGIYLYGDVGCGKTMLMDLFYQCVPSHLSRKRLHFHQFMQYVHKRCHEITRDVSSIASPGKNNKNAKTTFDPIPTLAYELSQESNILCFDEFQVTDVADAMILRRLISQIISDKYGVILFATSNREPDDLYINGVQRQSFIPCIELIKSKNHVIFLNSPTDYRKIAKPISSVYYLPPYGVNYHSKECVAKREAHVKQWYNYFAQSDAPKIDSHARVTVWGRQLDIPQCTAPYVAQFSYKQLCGGNLAAGDYLQLAKEFKGFVITDIPYLSILRRDEVRRFITFLDAVYDNNGKLATTGAARFTDLFVEPEYIIDDYELDLKKKKDDESMHEEEEKSAKEQQNDDLVTKHGFSKEIASQAKMFALDEERFAFARALSRLSQMSTTEWVEAQ